MIGETNMRTDGGCNLWFHPRKFVANNIQYRIASGKSIANYKNAQSFLMSEIAFNPFHTFSNVARETLLFKYDVWFDFLCEVEQFLLVEEGKYFTEETIKTVKLLSEERVRYYQTVIKDNPGIFEENYMKIWNEVHEMIYDYLVSSLTDLIGLNKSTAFSKLTEILINVMNHTLYELYEIDILQFSENDFIFNYDSVCTSYYDVFGESLILKKYEIFLKVRKPNGIIIKGYDDAPIPFEQSELKKILDKRGISYRVL